MSLLQKKRKRKFPDYQELGTDVYDVDNKIFGDNNLTNVLFTRPPQLGKTMLLSLAELLLSNTETALTGLESYPPDEVNNSWYAITFNLGGVGFTGGAEAKSRPEKSIKRFATPSSVASPVSCQSTGR